MSKTYIYIAKVQCIQLPIMCNQCLDKQKGFTLIELMISITLGLLITAAVMQVFLVSSRTSVIQASGSQIIDANIFGLQNVERRLKLANLGMAEAVNKYSASGGIVVSSNNIDGVKLEGDTDISIKLLTRGTADTPVGVASNNEWTGISNTDKVSDQLTIQYRAPQDMTDCEGQRVLGPREVTLTDYDKVIDGQVVIERYYLKNTDNGLALMCDAGRYMTTQSITIDPKQDALKTTDTPNPVSYFKKSGGGYTTNRVKDFGEAGSVIIPNVDDFQVLLGVMTAEGIQYVTSTDYIDPTKKIGTAPDDVELGTMPIVAIKIGIIASGSVALPGSEEGQSSFNLLGDDTELDDDADKNLIRKSYESNVMLRNARQI